jgi:hypothetical protein
VPAHLIFLTGIYSLAGPLADDSTSASGVSLMPKPCVSVSEEPALTCVFN